MSISVFIYLAVAILGLVAIFFASAPAWTVFVFIIALAIAGLLQGRTIT